MNLDNILNSTNNKYNMSQKIMINLSFLCMNRIIMKLNLNLKINISIIIKDIIIGAKVLKIVNNK